MREGGSPSSQGRTLAGVLRVGLTGGIGSGKSAVSSQLAARGAVVVDADQVAREVVEPGSPGLAAVVAEFGEEILRPDGALDREALGKRVFSDAAALARLNAIVHPLVGERTGELFEQAAARGADVVVHDVPLLVENGLAPLYDAIVVVAATPATQLDRLVRLRGMSPEDAQARIAAQSRLEDKLAVATYVVRNDGSREELVDQVERLWQTLTALADSRR